MFGKGLITGAETHIVALISNRWGDIKLKKTCDGTEYLEFNERQTKTRTGSDLSDVRKVRPKLWAMPGDPERCPVESYKTYAMKRPISFSQDDHPFYLAPRTTSLTSESDQWFLKMKLGEKKTCFNVKSHVHRRWFKSKQKCNIMQQENTSYLN